MSTLLRWLITGIKLGVQILVITWTTLAIYFSNLPWPALRLGLAVAFTAFAIWAFWLSRQRRMGKEENVIGPVLGVPYQYKFKTVKEIPAPDGKVERRKVEETATANAYFLPETLNVSGAVETQKLHRGIYEAVVYRAPTVLSGKFKRPILDRSRSI